MFLCTMTDPATYLFVGGPYLCGWSPAIANAAPAVAEDVIWLIFAGMYTVHWAKVWLSMWKIVEVYDNAHGPVSPKLV